jgi:glycosyltransferase involved in cell wall biosynthesis
MKLEELTDEEIQDHCAEIYPHIQHLQSDTPVATIGFPAYNEADYLIPSLKKMAALKTHQAVKLIAANNASTDRTKEILKACGITVLDEERKGTSFARQALVEAAEGDILIQTDADTQVPPTWIDAHLRHYNAPHVVGVSGKCYSDNYHPLWKVYRSVNWFAHQITDTIHRDTIPHVAGANFSAKIESLRATGGYQPDFNQNEDALIAHRLKKTGKIVVDNSREISVNTDGRRFMSTEQIVSHFRQRLTGRDFWKTIFLGRGEADISAKDFEDFR